MKKSVFWILISICLNSSGIENLPVSKINPELLTKFWSAWWVTYPDDSGLDYGVYHFRKTFILNETPDEFIIHVSADNRYRFFVNGIPLCFGPARGDVLHWRFESLDIAPYLKAGKNVIAAMVWNFAGLKPWAQITIRTGFILQGNSEKEKIVNTETGWKVIKNNAYKPANPDLETTGRDYMVVGTCDEVKASEYPWNWEKTDFDDSNWKDVKLIQHGSPKKAGAGIFWGLEPRPFPLMEAKSQRFSSVRRTENIKVEESFLSGKSTLRIPANQKVVILFDQGVLTTAYPELTVSGGVDSKIELQYAEALFDENGNKGNRSEIDGKKIQGYFDVFLPDGGEKRVFRPLWFRTWRYLQMTVTTMDTPLEIENFSSEFTGYPFQENAEFKCSDKLIDQIWKVGWRTARLCAGETFYDCPYYEQLQYVGDTRIQVFISLYVSGDDRLMRNALQMFEYSRFNEGLTMSRHPSSTLQVIPTYSLFWVDMVHDYWMLRDDPEFVKSFLNGIDAVLGYFIDRIDKGTGLIGYTGYWNFIDWTPQWSWDNETMIGGLPQSGIYGKSTILSLMVACSAQHAAELFRWSGNENKAVFYENIAGQMIKSVRTNCWDSSKKFYSESPQKDEFSIHTQIFAVLAGAVPENELKDFVIRLESDKSLIQPTMYFRFYLTQAIKKAGLADNYLKTIDLWRDMIGMGLTTFAETPEPTRSDCHAWSASPTYDFLATVAGIEPASSGFKTVRIEPHLGELKYIEGKMPHPSGMIQFSLKRKGEKGISGEVILPENLTGVFIWQGKTLNLKGQTEIEL